MRNWSTNLKELKKDKEKFNVWRLEQMINFGVGKGKINRENLEKYWLKIKIDPWRRKFLKLLLSEK